MFDPLEHQGIAVQDQLRSWRELDVQPIDPEAVDPEVRRQLALTRYVENQQQRAVNWLLPPWSRTASPRSGRPRRR